MFSCRSLVIVFDWQLMLISVILWSWPVLNFTLWVAILESWLDVRVPKVYQISLIYIVKFLVYNKSYDWSNILPMIFISFITFDNYKVISHFSILCFAGELLSFRSGLCTLVWQHYFMRIFPDLQNLRAIWKATVYY